MAQRDDWINIRMRKLLEGDYCPECHTHRTKHDDEACAMRFVKDEEEVYQ